jgi:hypothetical protein
MSPFAAIGGVLVLMGLAAFGVLSWGVRKVALLPRAVEAGDVAVLGVLAAFGLFCVVLGWRILRTREEAPSAPLESTAPRRVTVSQGFATAGVVLLILCVLVPSHWYPVVLFFSGLALLAVSHVLTPCEERIAKLRRARASTEQL